MTLFKLERQPLEDTIPAGLYYYDLPDTSFPGFTIRVERDMGLDDFLNDVGRSLGLSDEAVEAIRREHAA